MGGAVVVLAWLVASVVVTVVVAVIVLAVVVGVVARSVALLSEVGAFGCRIVVGFSSVSGVFKSVGAVSQFTDTWTLVLFLNTIHSVYALNDFCLSAVSLCYIYVEKSDGLTILRVKSVRIECKTGFPYRVRAKLVHFRNNNNKSAPIYWSGRIFFVISADNAAVWRSIAGVRVWRKAFQLFFHFGFHVERVDEFGYALLCDRRVDPGELL